MSASNGEGAAKVRVATNDPRQSAGNTRSRPAVAGTALPSGAVRASGAGEVAISRSTGVSISIGTPSEHDGNRDVDRRLIVPYVNFFESQVKNGNQLDR